MNDKEIIKKTLKNPNRDSFNDIEVSILMANARQDEREKIKFIIVKHSSFNADVVILDKIRKYLREGLK